MKHIVLYACAAAVSFILFLAVFAPASVAYRFVKDDLARALPQASFEGIAGSVWEGRAVIVYEQTAPMRLVWEISPLTLLSLEPLINADLQGEGLHLYGPIKIVDDQVMVSVAGSIDSGFINPIATGYGLEFPGELLIDSLTFTTLPGWAEDVVGHLTWSGGRVFYQTALGRQAVDLPPLDGVLFEDGEEIVLEILNTSNKILEIGLKPTGWARIEVKARLFVLAKLDWPVGANLDEAVLVLEEKLF